LIINKNQFNTSNHIYGIGFSLLKLDMRGLPEFDLSGKVFVGKDMYGEL